MKIQGVSLTDRIIHAVGYELIAVLVCAPLISWALGKSLASAGVLALSLSLIAMLWNLLYNALVDRHVRRPRVRWSLAGRIVHGVGFEAGMIVLGVPVAAWLLGVSLFQAFLIELGFFAFILPYTVVYNWAFDKARHHLWRRQEQASAAA